MKKKKIVALLICAVLLVGTLALTGCSNTGYKAAFDAYMKAQDDVSTEGVIDILPPDMYNYYYDKFKNNGRGIEYTEEEIQNLINERYITKIDSADFLKMDSSIDLVNDISFNYSIVEEYNASAKEVKEFNEYVSEKLGFKNKAQDIVLIEYKFSLLVNGEVNDSFDDVTSYGVCIKMNGKWYYAEASLSNEIMWIDREGLTVHDGLEWIYNWF